MKLASGFKTVTVTTTSKTLAALGADVPDDVVKVLLVPAGTVRWAKGGAASGSTPLVPNGTAGFSYPETTDGAKQLQFYASNVAMDVYFITE